MATRACALCPSILSLFPPSPVSLVGQFFKERMYRQTHLGADELLMSIFVPETRELEFANGYKVILLMMMLSLFLTPKGTTFKNKETRHLRYIGSYTSTQLGRRACAAPGFFLQDPLPLTRA